MWYFASKYAAAADTPAMATPVAVVSLTSSYISEIVSVVPVDISGVSEWLRERNERKTKVKDGVRIYKTYISFTFGARIYSTGDTDVFVYKTAEGSRWMHERQILADLGMRLDGIFGSEKH
jgi:hypothetical protein